MSDKLDLADRLDAIADRLEDLYANPKAIIAVIVAVLVPLLLGIGAYNSWSDSQERQAELEQRIQVKNDLRLQECLAAVEAGVSAGDTQGCYALWGPRQ